MRCKCSARFLACVALVLLLLPPGCSSPPHSSDVSFTAPVLVSKDGKLRYRVPRGWFDATAHPKAPPSGIWVVRNDFAASLTISRVEIDVLTQRELSDGGLLRVGELTMELATSSRLARVVEAPVIVHAGDREYCLYEIEEAATHDVLRVVLFASGEGVYEVKALASGGMSADERRNVSAVQRGFLQQLRW